MKILLGIILISQLLSIPQEINIPDQTSYIAYLPVVFKPCNGETAMDAEVNDNATTVILSNHCGKYMEWGAHPCHHTDSATPSAYTHRNNVVHTPGGLK